MAVAPNPLLQLGTPSKTSAATALTSAKVLQEPQNKGSSFADVYAKQHQNVPAKADVVVKSAKDRTADAAKADSKAPEKKPETAAKDPAVAASGKALPANSADKTGKGEKADDADDTDTAADDEAVATAAAEPLEPTAAPADPATQTVAIDPALLQPAAVDPALAAMVAQPASPAVSEALAANDSGEAVAEDFDPTQDVLADLPAVRLALEHNAKAQGTTSAHASTQDPNAANSADPTSDQHFVNGLAAMVEKERSSGGEGGDQAFSGLIDDGLKDLKGAAGDTRVDNFAERLQSLTQAATAKTANAVVPASPLGQPLPMQQGGWTEGLVNRVMYLSSQNLKSADIQLAPPELGRLDIRVDMTPDQQTQVTFTSAHIGVREALESQQTRLKEMFAEQGMGQLDVNVSDQSRQQAEQQAQQQAQQARQMADSGVQRSDASAAELAAEHSPARAVVTDTVVVGSSAVDYYA